MSEFVRSRQEERARSYIEEKYPVTEKDVDAFVLKASVFATSRLSAASWLMNAANYEAEGKGIARLPAMLAAVRELETNTSPELKQLTLIRHLELLSTGELTSAQHSANRRWKFDGVLEHTTKAISLLNFLEVLK